MKQIQVLAAVIIAGVLACVWGVSSSSGDGSGLFEQGLGGIAGVSSWNGRTGNVTTRNVSAAYKNLSAASFYGDGSHLTGISGGSGLGTYTTLRPSDLIAKGPWVDVRSYGADATGNVDSTGAIQKAVSSQGRAVTVFFPYGNYKFTNLTGFYPGTRLVGQSWSNNGSVNRTMLTCIGTGDSIRIGKDNGHAWDAAEYDGVDKVHLEHIYLTHGAPDTPLDSDSTLTTSYKAGCYGIRDWRGGSVVLEDCMIRKFEYGFWGIQSDFDNFIDCEIWDNHVGVYLGPRSDQYTFERCRFMVNDISVLVDGAWNGSFINCRDDSDGTSTTCPFTFAGSWARGTGGATFKDFSFETDGTYGPTGVPAYIDLGNGSTYPVYDITVENATLLNNALSPVTRRAYSLIRSDNADGIKIDGLNNKGNTTVDLDQLIEFIGTASPNFVAVRKGRLTIPTVYVNHGSGTPYVTTTWEKWGRFGANNFLINGDTSTSRQLIYATGNDTYQWILGMMAGDANNDVEIRACNDNGTTRWVLAHLTRATGVTTWYRPFFVNNTTSRWNGDVPHSRTAHNNYSGFQHAEHVSLDGKIGLKCDASTFINYTSEQARHSQKYINGADYGMKGQDTAFNNRTAFDRAATAAVVAGVPLYIPPAASAYYARSPFQPPAGLEMYGVKPFYDGATLVNGTVLKTPSWTTISIQQSNVTIHDLGVTGSGNGVSVVGSGTEAKNYVRRVVALGQSGSGHGFLVEGQGGNIIDTFIDDCESWGPYYHGFVSKSKRCRFRHCKAVGHTTNGFVAVSDNMTGSTKNSIGEDIEFLDCIAENCPNGYNIYSREYYSGSGGTVVPIKDLRIIGGSVKNCVNGVLVGESFTPYGYTYQTLASTNILISGVSFEYNTLRGISLQKGDNVHIVSNTFSNNSTAIWRNTTTVSPSNLKVGLNSIDHKAGNCSSYVPPAPTFPNTTAFWRADGTWRKPNGTGSGGGISSESDPVFSGWSTTTARTTGTGTKNYYYDWYNGSDSNTGTQASPMKTPQGIIDRYIKGRLRTCNINVYSNNTGFQPNFTLVNSINSGANYSLNFNGDTTADVTITGTVTSASTSLVIDVSAPDFTPYLAYDCFIKFTSGVDNGIYRRVTGWNNGSKTYTVELLPSSPANGDTYSITVSRPNRAKYKIRGTLSPPTGSNGVVKLTNCQNVNVNGYDISNTTASQHGVNYTNSSGGLTGCSVHDCASEGVHWEQPLATGNALTYVNSYSNGSYGLGVYNGVRNGQAYFATIRNNTGNGVFIHSSSDVSFTHSSIYANGGGGGTTGNGVQVQRHSQVMLSDTYLSYQLYGIFAYTSYVWMAGIYAVIDCSSITGSYGVALYYSSFLDGVTSNNYIKNCATYGAYADPVSGGWTSGTTFSNNGTNLFNDTAARLR